jgi:hypothetical protein
VSGVKWEECDGDMIRVERMFCKGGGSEKGVKNWGSEFGRTN